MSGEVISVLSLEGRYYDIVTRVIQLISPSQSSQKKRYQSGISFLCPPVINLLKAQVCDKTANTP